MDLFSVIVLVHIASFLLKCIYDDIFFHPTRD